MYLLIIETPHSLSQKTTPVYTDPVGVVICFSLNGRCPSPCSTTFNVKRYYIIFLSFSDHILVQYIIIRTEYYQTNEAICVEDEVMLGSFRIPDERVHPSYLRHNTLFL